MDLDGFGACNFHLVGEEDLQILGVVVGLPDDPIKLEEYLTSQGEAN
jgi:hypothetical protein